MLLLGQIAGWIAMPAELMVLSLPPTGVLLVMRLLDLRFGNGLNLPRAWLPLWALHTVMAVAASLANPFTAIYAFTGYFDVRTVVPQIRARVVIVSTSLTSALGQAGGWYGVIAVPWVLLILAVINLGIATIMIRLDREREAQVAERERAAAELAEAHAQNLALHDQLVDRAREAGITSERARLSREIHDTVAQGLVGVIRQLEALPDQQDPTVRRRLRTAEQSARDCLDQARRAVAALAPKELQTTGLDDAVRAEVTSWSSRTGNPAELVLDGDPADGDRDPVVLRVLQESLTNVARHAGPCEVTVSLSWGHEVIMLDVNDTGVGFVPERVAGHGLVGMAARVDEVGGKFSVESRPDRGCTVSAMVPR